MEENGTDKSAGEVVAPGAVPATTGGQTGSASEVGSGSEAAWKARIGDTEYGEPDLKTKMVEDYKKLHGSYTQSRQELSRFRQDSESFQELLGVIRSDPGLLAEVRKRIAQGQSPEQAVQKTAEHALTEDPQFQSLHKDVESMKQERATEAFYSKHPDLSDEDNDAIVKWIDGHAEKLNRAGWSYEEVLDHAHAIVFRERMAPKLIEQGQKMKEEEIVKGQKSKTLGAPSPTARTASKKIDGPSYKLKPSERLERAMEEFQKHGKK